MFIGEVFRGCETLGEEETILQILLLFQGAGVQIYWGFSNGE